MKQRTKENLGNIFGGLFSNQKAINGSKHNPWWVAIIMFILGIVFPIIPITVGQYSQYGSQFLNGNTYGWENQITKASLDLYTEGYDFVVGEDNLISITKDGSDYTLPSTYKDSEALYTYTNTVTGQIDFQVYYSEKPLKSTDKNTKTVYDLVEALLAKRWILGTNKESDGTENTKTSESQEEVKYYRPSFMLIYNHGLYSYLGLPNKVDKAGTSGGDWNNTPKGIGILESVLKVEGYNLPLNSTEGDDLFTDSTYVEGVYKNWIGLYNDSYIYTRNSSTLTTTLIFLGVYAVLTIFMGLMIFLLTRGKKNSFNYLTFWACLKIEFWASVSPGLLGLILGFLMPSYAMMYFIIFLGLRTMWISTKQLRPTY